MKKIDFSGNKNIVGEIVRKSRIEKRLSQGELAAKLQTVGVNIDQQMISRIENNLRIVTDYEMFLLFALLEVNIENVFIDFKEKFLK